MISMKELLAGNKLEDLPKEHQENLTKLLQVVNILRNKYNKPMTVSSGYRSLVQHLRIYNDKGITDIKLIPMKSNHLSGLAVDFADPDNQLKDFINDNVPLMEQLGLYMEDFKHTSNWVHVQLIAPKSGKRFFIP